MKDLKSRKSGFTLIELLVVIAIIAILAAILFPVFARARENARRASCQSNEKQIGLAIMQYQQDYDETCILRGYEYEDNKMRWTDLIQPYAKSGQVLDCPSASSATNYVPYPTRTGAQHGSYAINFAYYSSGDNFTPPTSDGSTGIIKLAQIEAAATTVQVLENRADLSASYSYACWWADSSTGPINSPTDNPPSFYGENSTGSEARHLGTMNVLYCDGHVKAKRPDDLIATKNIGGKQIATAFTIQDD